MMNKNIFKKVITSSFENTAYVKKGQSWYLDGEDAIIVVNLQKSNFGEEYFMNIGIWLKGLGSTLFPKENQCHLFIRLERLFPEDRELITRGFSLETTNMQTLSDLSEFIKFKLFPFLQDCTNINKLKDFAAMGKFKAGLIRKETKDYLE